MDDKLDYSNEEWKDIEGFEGYYQVSTMGRIRSLDRDVNYGKYIRTVKGQLRKLGDNTNTGYLGVTLCKEGKHYSRDVHRIVAETFIPKPDDNRKYVVDHINFDKHDNRVENLRWVTQTENIHHSIKNGRVDIEKRIAILNDPQVRMNNLKVSRHPVIRSDGKIFESVTAAAKELCCDRRAITLVLSGQNKTCKGYTFKYYSEGSGE